MAEFTATFNPSPNPPTSFPFNLTTDENGEPVPFPNLIVAPAAATEVSISITLAGGASFPTSRPIVWALDPGVEVVYILSGSTLSFTVPTPLHVLHPWVFRFIADVPGIQGVRSQNIYVAKPASGNSFILQYAPDNGNFSLVDSLDTGQDGAILGAELVMVNTQLDEIIVNIDPTVVQFTPPGIYWAGSASAPPAAIGVSYTPITSLASSLSFTIDSASQGQSIALQFAIATADGVTILSPDPILINATIGDG